MSKYNKATGAGLGGSVVVVILALTGWEPTPEVAGALTTIVTTLLVLFLPNDPA